MRLHEASDLLTAVGLPNVINSEDCMSISNSVVNNVSSGQRTLGVCASLVFRADEGWHFISDMNGTGSPKIQPMQSSEKLSDIVDMVIRYYKGNDLFILDPVIVVSYAQ